MNIDNPTFRSVTTPRATAQPTGPSSSRQSTSSASIAAPITAGTPNAPAAALANTSPSTSSTSNAVGPRALQLQAQGATTGVFAPGARNVSLEELKTLNPETKFFKLDGATLDLAAFHQVVAARNGEGLNTKTFFTGKVGLSMRGTRVVDAEGKTLDPIVLLRNASYGEFSKGRSPTVGFIDLRGVVRPADAAPLETEVTATFQNFGIRQLFAYPLKDGFVFVSRDAAKLEAASSAGLDVPATDALKRTFGEHAAPLTPAAFPAAFSAFGAPVHGFNGSTDAELVALPSGEKFVKKFANSEEQLVREWITYKIAEAHGIPQPRAQVYAGERKDPKTGETKTRPVMVSEFIPDTTTVGMVLTGDPAQDKPVTDELKKAIIPLTIPGDRDALGLCQANVLVRKDKNGLPVPIALYFVDRGASFGKAAAGRNRDNFDAMGVVQDLNDYFTFHVSNTFLGNLSSAELASMIRTGVAQEEKILSAIDAGAADLHATGTVPKDENFQDLKDMVRARCLELRKLEKTLLAAGPAPAAKVLEAATKAINQIREEQAAVAPAGTSK